MRGIVQAPPVRCSTQPDRAGRLYRLSGSAGGGTDSQIAADGVQLSTVQRYDQQNAAAASHATAPHGQRIAANHRG